MFIVKDKYSANRFLIHSQEDFRNQILRAKHWWFVEFQVCNSSFDLFDRSFPSAFVSKLKHQDSCSFIKIPAKFNMCSETDG